MMVRKVTSAKYCLKQEVLRVSPVRSSRTDSQLGSGGHSQTWSLYSLLQWKGLEPSPLLAGKSPGQMALLWLLGTAAHTPELHVELAGGSGSFMSAVRSQGHPFSQMATHVAHVHCAIFEFFVFFKKWTMHFYCTEFAFPFPLKVCMYFTVTCFIGVNLGSLLFLMSY